MTETLLTDQFKSIIKETILQIENQKTIYLQDLKHPELELKKPLPVFIEYDDDYVIANYYDTESFGYGDSEYEAINNLCKEIVQTYSDLEIDQTNLGPLPMKWWDHFQTIIQRKN